MKGRKWIADRFTTCGRHKQKYINTYLKLKNTQLQLWLSLKKDQTKVESERVSIDRRNDGRKWNALRRTDLPLKQTDLALAADRHTHKQKIEKYTFDSLPACLGVERQTEHCSKTGSQRQLWPKKSTSDILWLRRGCFEQTPHWRKILRKRWSESGSFTNSFCRRIHINEEFFLDLWQYSS